MRFTSNYEAYLKRVDKRGPVWGWGFVFIRKVLTVRDGRQGEDELKGIGEGKALV